MAGKKVEEEIYIFQEVVTGKRGISKWNMGFFFPFLNLLVI